MDFRTSNKATDIRTHERPDLFTEESTETFLRDYFRETGHLEEYDSGEFFMTEEMEDAVEALSPSEHRSWDSLPDAVKRRIMMQSLRKVATRYENDIFLNTEREQEEERLSDEDRAAYGQTGNGADTKAHLQSVEEAVEEEMEGEAIAEAEREESLRRLRLRLEKMTEEKDAAVEEDIFVPKNRKGPGDTNSTPYSLHPEMTIEARLKAMEEEEEEELSKEDLPDDQKKRRQEYLRRQYARLRAGKAFEEAKAAEKALQQPGFTKEEQDALRKELKNRYAALLESEVFTEVKSLAGEDIARTSKEDELTKEESLKRLRIRLEKMTEEEEADEYEDAFLNLKPEEKSPGEDGMFYSERLRKQLDSLHPEKPEDTTDPSEEIFPRSAGQFGASSRTEISADERRKRSISYQMYRQRNAKGRKKGAFGAIQMLEEEGSDVPGMEGSEEIRTVGQYESRAVFFTDDEQDRQVYSTQPSTTQEEQSAALRRQRSAWQMSVKKQEKESGKKLDGYVVLDRDNRVVWSSEMDERAKLRDMDEKIASMREEAEKTSADSGTESLSEQFSDGTGTESLSGQSTITSRTVETKSENKKRADRLEQEEIPTHAFRTEEKRKERTAAVSAQEAVLIRALRSNQDTESEKNTRMKEALRLQQNAQKRKAVLAASTYEKEKTREAVSRGVSSGRGSTAGVVRDGLGEALRDTQKATASVQSGIVSAEKTAAAGRQGTSTARGGTSTGNYSEMTKEGVSEIISASAGAAGFMKAAGADLLTGNIRRALSKEILHMGNQARKKTAQKASAQNEEMQKANNAAEKYAETAGRAAKKAAQTGTLLVQAGKGASAAVIPFPFKVAFALIGLLATIVLLWLGFHLVDKGGNHAEVASVKSTYTSDGVGEEVVEYAKSFIKVTKYVYGANNFPKETDCSGFVQAIFKHFGVDLNRDTVGMQQNGTLVTTNTLDDAAVGDIIIFHPAGSGRDSHVGIYAGEGKMVDNSSSNGGPVYRDVYQTNDIQVRRVLDGASLTGLEMGNVSNNAEGVYKAFRRAGFTKEGAAAATGNFLHESGLNGHSCEPWNAVSDQAEIKYTEMVNNGFGKTKTSPSYITEYQFIHAAPCPDGGYWTSNWGWGYGIAQWTDSGRRTNLYNAYKRLRTKYGSQISIDSMQVQVSCVIDECENPNNKNLHYAYQKMKDSSYKGESGIEALTYIWFDRFEWNTDKDHVDPDGSGPSRYQNALDCYKKYSELDPGEDSAPLASSSGYLGNTDLADLKKLLDLFGSSVTIDDLNEYVDDYIQNDSGFDNTPGDGNTGGNNGKEVNPATTISDDPVAKKCKYGYVQGTKKGKLKESDSNNNRSTFKNTYGLDSSLSYFHPGWYYARITKKGKYKAIDGGDPVTVSSGTTGIIIGHTSWGKKAYFRLANGRTISVPKGSYKVLSILYNSSKAYTNAQVEEWINRQNITGKTKSGYRVKKVDTVILVSTYNQRAWILEGSNHNWKVVKGYNGKKCSTVAMNSNTSWPAPQPYYPYKNYLACNTKYAQGFGRAASLKNTRSYVNKAGGNQLHVGGKGYPNTHGCIAFTYKMMSAIYKMELGTPVVVF